MTNIANMKEFINELNSGEIDIENDEDYLDNYTRLFLDDNSKNVYYGFVYNYFGDTVVINLDMGEIGYWNYDTCSLDKVDSVPVSGAMKELKYQLLELDYDDIITHVN